VKQESEITVTVDPIKAPGVFQFGAGKARG
jgi:hypothetical protein